MNWKKATLSQLREIAFIDPDVHPVYRQLAHIELLRRRPKRWHRVNFKMKKVYPR